MAAELTIVLDAERAAALAHLAGRSDLDPERFAERLLSAVIDTASVGSDELTRVLDDIPGAWERAQHGRADIDAGRGISLDEL